MIVQIVSWNVNTNQKISKELLLKLLKINYKAEFIVTSLQEIKSQFSPRDNIQEWVDLLSTIENYSLVESIKINGIALIIIKKNESLINNVKVKCGALGCGLMGFYGNKGAAAIGLEFSLTDSGKFCSVCFVAMHLDAHVRKFNERNKSAQYLFSTLLLKGDSETRLIHDYDVVFVAGDLNYRFETKDNDSKERKEIDAMIDSRDVQGLRERDELKLNAGPWDSWKEGEITFLPTYKYNLKSNSTSALSVQFSKSRNPAYTDRILFKSLKSDVKVLMYDSIPGMGFSDHQPVYGGFLVDFDSPTISRQYMSSRDLILRSTWYKIIRVLEMNWVLWVFVMFYMLFRLLY